MEKRKGEDSVVKEIGRKEKYGGTNEEKRYERGRNGLKK